MSTPVHLLDVLAEIPDPRKARGVRHPLQAILALAILAMLCGNKSLQAIAQFGREKAATIAVLLGFRRFKTPTASTLSLVFRSLDVVAFESALARWVASRLPAGAQLVIAIDGKTLRGSSDGGLPGQHLLAAYAREFDAVINQLRVDAKTNEHKAALQLLGVLPLKGNLITGDAAFCQRDLCEKIIDAGGDYLFTAKDNQPSLVIDVGAGLAFEDQARRLQAAFSPRR